MGNNSLITPKMTTFNQLDNLINNLEVLSGFNTTWEKDFAIKDKKIGDTELIRKPQRWIAKDGMGYQPQPISDTYTTMTIDTNKQIGFDWGAFDETLSIEDQDERYFKTSNLQLANAWDDLACGYAYQNTPNYTGTLGTNPASLADSQTLFLLAFAILKENGCSKGNLMSVLSPRLSAAVVQYLNTNYNPQESLGKQFTSGQIMSKLLGFDRVSVDQNIRNHTAGTFVGTPLVNGASVNGDTQIVTDGWTAGDTLNPGDIFAVGSVNNVNPMNRRSTGVAKRLVVGGGVQLVADSGGNMTIPIGGGVVLYDSSQQYADVDNLPADNAALTIWPGTGSPTGKSGVQSLAFGKQAFGFAGIKLPKMAGCNIAESVQDPDTGISISIHQGSDIKTFERISRMDSAGGLCVLYPDNESVRIVGA